MAAFYRSQLIQAKFQKNIKIHKFLKIYDFPAFINAFLPDFCENNKLKTAKENQNQLGEIPRTK